MKVSGRAQSTDNRGSRFRQPLVSINNLVTTNDQIDYLLLSDFAKVDLSFVATISRPTSDLYEGLRKSAIN